MPFQHCVCGNGGYARFSRIQSAAWACGTAGRPAICATCCWYKNAKSAAAPSCARNGTVHIPGAMYHWGRANMRTSENGPNQAPKAELSKGVAVSVLRNTIDVDM